jgi:hypothetical protein
MRQSDRVRFRNTAGAGKFLSVDNVRLEVFSFPATNTAFTNSWATTLDRPWVGAEFLGRIVCRIGKSPAGGFNRGSGWRPSRCGPFIG